jgi:hypothetical protein
MAANVQIHEMTALAAGLDRTGATIRFKSADNTNVDTLDRIQIPGAGTTYSYTKQVRFYFQTGPSVDIQNLRAYSDGGNGFGTGVGCQYDIPNTGNGTFPNINTNIAGTDIFSKTSGVPISMAANNVGPYTGTGYKGDIVRMQLSVSSAAAPGQIPAETLTFAYDET